MNVSLKFESAPVFRTMSSEDSTVSYKAVYGFVRADIDFSNRPASRESLLEGDILLRDMLNCETIEVAISRAEVCESGFLRVDTWILCIGSVRHYAEVEILQYDREFAKCKLRMTEPLHNLRIPKKRLVRICGGMQKLQAVQLCLNEPEKYYLTKDEAFFMKAPEGPHDFIRFYEIKRARESLAKKEAAMYASKPKIPKIMKCSSPKGADIVLDPMLYLDCGFKPAAEFARMVLTGDYSF